MADNPKFTGHSTVMNFNPYVFGSASLCRHLPKDTATGVLVGVWRGTDAIVFLEHMPELHLTLVDDWSFRGLPVKTARQAPTMRIRETAHAALARFADRVTWREMESARAAAMTFDGTLDFVYLDGNHEYTAVRQDISDWRQCVRPGGILAGHDYGHPEFPGVKNAVGTWMSGNMEVEGTVWRTIV